MYNKKEDCILLYEINKMCDLLSKYDRSWFNNPATDKEIVDCEQMGNIKIPDILKNIYKVANGFQILGRTAQIYRLEDIGYRFENVPEEYVVFGEIVGDGEKLCFNEKTGEIVTVHEDRISPYSIKGFLEYCVDQCKDGFFMSKVDIKKCCELNTEILKDIQKIYSLKSVTISELANVFIQSTNAQKEAFMYYLPIIIRSAVFSSLEKMQCTEFVNYLKSQDTIKADNFIRGMRRRAIDNFFNRERQFLDDGKASFPWNVKQMREIYNFDAQGMSYQNAGIVKVYDAGENMVKEVVLGRANERKFIDKKMGITYLYDVYTDVQYAGNMNNIKLKG